MCNESIRDGYTRISEILSQWDTFGHIDQNVLANKAAIGTRVHESIRDHHKGFFYPLNDKEYAYVESYLKWEDSVKPQLLFSEERYYCDEMKITGQVDSIVKIEGEDLPILIDYKTSVSENKKMWPLQACFYHYLVIKGGMELSPKIIFLKLHKEGKMPKVCEYKFTEKHWDICTSAWNCFNYLKK